MHKFLLTTVLAFLFCSTAALAQYAIKGVVQDVDSLNALSGASISYSPAADTARKTIITTKADGAFSIAALAPGSYRLLI